MRSGPWTLLVLSVIVTSCAAAQTPKRSQQRAPRKLQQGEVKTENLFADLGPVASGTGVIVFEPVATGMDEAVSQFGDGCSMWLQFVVGGHGELGKTPSWVSIMQAAEGRGLRNLRARSAEAVAITGAVGATHAVLGEIRG